MWRCVGVLGLLLLITGCQSTHEDLIAKGRQRVAELSWEKAARATIAAYEDALA